jgi:hypothetical protein
MLDTVTKLEKEGKKGSYIDGIRKEIISWLRFNEIELKNRARINGAKDFLRKHEDARADRDSTDFRPRSSED